MAAPRKAHLSGTVTWSDGSNFDGFVLLGLAIPSDSNGQWPTVALGAEFPLQRIPQWTIIPIKDGAFDQSTTVFFNADIQPRNCRYAAYFYDINRRRIAPAGAASLFDITADPYAITVPTLTVPTAAVVAPTPET